MRRTLATVVVLLLAAAPATAQLRFCAFEPRFAGVQQTAQVYLFVPAGSACTLRLAAPAPVLSLFPRRGVATLGEGSLRYAPQPGFAGDDEFHVSWMETVEGQRIRRTAVVKVEVVRAPAGR